MKILALGHRKQTGKDTLARFIASRLRLNNRGLNVIVAGFADELKDTVYRLYGWAGVKPKEYYEAHQAEREVILPQIGMSYRAKLIQIGNHTRAIDECVWSNALLKKLNVDVLIIKDLRFPHEITQVHSCGGHVVKVVRPGIPEDTDGADEPLATFNEWDHIVVNDGDLNKLNQAADFLIQKFKLGN